MTNLRPAPVPCAYCQLPVPGSAQSQPGIEPTLFCCYGCRLASEITQGTGEEAVVRWMLVRVGTAIFLTLNLMAFTMALWTPDVYGPVMGNSQMEKTYTDLFRYLSLIVSTPVMLLLGPALARSAWVGLRMGNPGTDLLVVIGVWAAFMASVFAVFAGTGPIYFEVACVVLIFVTLGRWLEASGKLHTQKAMDDLTRLMPKEALVIQAGEVKLIPVDQIRIGDTLQLRPGDRVACDAVLAAGDATLDEQILTGESRPVWKRPGDSLLGGTLLVEGTATAKVSASVDQSTIARLIEHVREARDAKGRYARMADRVARWLLPVVLVLAVVSGIWHGSHGGVAHGSLVALSVLLIACPCAVGLATPLAVWSAMGAAAKRGILFADGEVLEKLAEIDVVFFDKTGTLTTGQPDLLRHQGNQNQAEPSEYPLLRELSARSAHPLAKCLNDSLLPTNQPESALNAGSPIAAQPIAVETDLVFRTLPGRGLLAFRSGTEDRPLAVLGSPALMAESGVVLDSPILERLAESQAAGHSILIFAALQNPPVQAIFSFDESLRPDSLEAVELLKKLPNSPELAILTGDHRQAAERLAAMLKIQFYAELLPHQKQELVRQKQHEGHRVAFVGEGYNDAPAMATADVGIALGAGADLTRDNAAVCILGNQITAVPYVLDLASTTVRRIRRNLFWAFFYNIMGLFLAIAGLLSPTIAAGIMFVSSIAVVAGSWKQSDPDGDEQELEPESTEASWRTQLT